MGSSLQGPLLNDLVDVSFTSESTEKVDDHQCFGLVNWSIQHCRKENPCSWLGGLERLRDETLCLHFHVFGITRNIFFANFEHFDSTKRIVFRVFFDMLFLLGGWGGSLNDVPWQAHTC